MARWFKAQTPVYTTGDNMQVLIYNADRSFMEQIEGNVADKIITALNMTPMGDKVYFKGTINKQGKLVVNKDTINREYDKYDW